MGRAGFLTLPLALATAAPSAPMRSPATVPANDARLEQTDLVRYGGRPFTGIVAQEGALSTRRRFLKGREQGVHEGWWPGGRPVFRYEYRNGVLHGRSLEWFEDGTMHRRFQYVEGHEEGLQQMWYADGTLRASYVVRDGRRFGLLGAKGCTGEDM